MARAWFFRGSEDFFVSGPLAPGDPYRSPSGGFEVTFWDAEVGGTQYDDLLLGGTTPVTSVTVSDPANPPPFQGPDQVVAMWAQAAGSTTRRMIDAGADIATIAQAAADLAAEAQAAAEAAAAAAAAVGATTDAQVEASLESRGLPTTGAALEASTADSIEPGETAPQAAVDKRVLDGAVARTTRTKHAPALGLYFPEAEGAAGDGVADDTAAVQAAWAAALAADGTLYLGAPAYRTTASLTAVRTHTGIAPGPKVEGLGKWKTQILCDFDNGAAFDITGCITTAGGSTATFWHGGHIRGLNVAIASGRTGVHGIKAVGWWYADIKDVGTRISGDGIHIPLRTDINANPDYYACAGWHIHFCDLSNSTGGSGINAPGGLAFGAALIERNRLCDNYLNGAWLAGHLNRVQGNAIARNGMFAGSTAGYGVVCGFVTGQAVPNGFVVENNELQANRLANVLIWAGAGYNVGLNRHISNVDTIDGVTALYPPVHVALGLASDVRQVTGRLPGNHHRSDTTGSYAVSAYKPAHTSASGAVIENPTYGTNSSALVKYDGFNVNHRTEAIEGGKVVQVAPFSRHYLGRLRAATNVTGSYATIAFDNEWQDPNNDNDTALGFLTPYAAGVYEVKVALTITGLAAGNVVTIAVRSDTTDLKEYTFPASGITDQTFSFSTRIYIGTAGSRITVWAKQNNGTDKAIKVGDAYNEFSVVGMR